MFCTNCGTEFEGNFCPNCGTPTQKKGKIQKSNASAPSERPPAVFAGNQFFKVTAKPGRELTPRQKKMAEAYAQRERAKEAAKTQIQENKLNGVPMCPRCNSTSIQQNNKFHLGRAALGDLLVPGGAVMGLTHGKKIPMVCLNCGYKWSLKTK